MGFVDVVRHLLQHGSNVNTRVDLDVEFIDEWQREARRYGDALHAACAGRYASAEKYAEIVQLLLEAGADPHLDCGCYGTPLVAACTMGNASVVEKLLQSGVNVNARVDLDIESFELNSSEYKDRRHGNALQTACADGLYRIQSPVEIVQLLLEAEADPNMVCGEHGTPLIAACNSKRLDVVKKLLEYGADPNIVCGRFGTALVAACHGGCLDIVKMLLSFKDNVNVQVDEEPTLKEDGTTVAGESRGCWWGTALHAACANPTDENV